jgi:hypothetical protein
MADASDCNQRKSIRIGEQFYSPAGIRRAITYALIAAMIGCLFVLCLHNFGARFEGKPVERASYHLGMGGSYFLMRRAPEAVSSML